MKKLFYWIFLLFISSKVFAFSAIDPTSIFGTKLQLWLDGGDDTSMYTTSTQTGTIVNVGNGAPVCAWKDKSGNGRDALQATQTACPHWAFNSFTGQNGAAIPAVSFDGATERLVVSNIFDSSYNTAFSAFVSVSSGGINGTYVELNDSGNVWYLARGSNVNSKISNLTPSTTLASVQSNFLQLDGFGYNGSNAYLWGRNTFHKAETGNLGLGSNLSIGAQNGSFSFAYQGPIGDVVIVKGVPTQSQLAQLYTYESAKYGLFVTTQAWANIYCDGNSLTYGYKPSDGTSQSITPANYPAQLQSVLSGAGIGAYVQNHGVTGITTETMVTNSTAGVQAAYLAPSAINIDVFWEITNDLVNQLYTVGNDSTTSANIAYAQVVQYCNLLKAAGWKVAVGTCIDRNVSMQGTQSLFDLARLNVNAQIRSNWRSFADYLIDLGGTQSLGQVGDYPNTTYFASDGVHLTAQGFAVVVSSVYTAITNIISSNVAIAPIGISNSGSNGSRSLFSSLIGGN